MSESDIKGRIPDFIIDELARSLLPIIRAYFENQDTQEGQA